MNALPISDVFIAKRIEHEWVFFDLYKIDNNFDTIITLNGLIELNQNNSMNLIEANYLAIRRKDLHGLSIPCGLVVSLHHLRKKVYLNLLIKLNSVPLKSVFRLHIPKSSHMLMIQQQITLTSFRRLI